MYARESVRPLHGWNQAVGRDEAGVNSKMAPWNGAPLRGGCFDEPRTGDAKVCQSAEPQKDYITPLDTIWRMPGEISDAFWVDHLCNASNQRTGDGATDSEVQAQRSALP